jgi:hypothetical protein
MEKFLHSDVDKFALSIFVKIRISNSNLNIERGRNPISASKSFILEH